METKMPMMDEINFLLQQLAPHSQIGYHFFETATFTEKVGTCHLGSSKTSFPTATDHLFSFFAQFGSSIGVFLEERSSKSILKPA